LASCIIGVVQTCSYRSRRDILVAAREQGRLTVQEVQRLTGANRNTIEAHIKGLVQKRLLTRERNGKCTWYRP
jgi:Fic family protein